MGELRELKDLGRNFYTRDIYVNRGQKYIEDWLKSKYSGNKTFKAKFELAFQNRRTYYNNYYHYDKAWSSTTTSFNSTLTVYNASEIVPIMNVLNITGIKVFLAIDPPPGLMWAKCQRKKNDFKSQLECACDDAHV